MGLVVDQGQPPPGATTFLLFVINFLITSEPARAWFISKLLPREDHSKRVINVSREAIIVLTHDKHILHHNPTAARTFEEFGEDTLIDFITGMKTTSADWSNGESFLEIELLDADEDRVHDDNAYIVASIRNVTAARRELSELQAALADAERANEAKTRFVIMLSHELRTPLNAVVGYSEMIADAAQEYDHEAIMEDADALLSATEHLRALVSSTLDLAKIESGQLLLDITPVAISNVLYEVGRAMNPAIEANDNVLILDLDLPPDFTVDTDNLKLRQILMNLLSNAAKYTRSGRVILSAKTSDDHVVIEITDDGEGMSPRTLERVWDEFVQADETALSQNGGTGLGLALVKQLTEFVGGRIDVTSALGEGTTFTITLPLSSTPNRAITFESLGA